MDTRYKFVLFNKAKAGHDLEVVKSNLAKELKITTEKLTESLTQKPLVLKRNLTQEQAVKYAQFADKIGIVYKIVAEDSPSTPALSGNAENAAHTASPNKIACPKCGLVQDKAVQCAQCGIIFEKYAALKEKNAAANQDHNPSKKRPLTALILLTAFVACIVVATFFYLKFNPFGDSEAIAQNFVNNGGRWVLISNENAPSKRWGHTSGWTGSRYWVYGGTTSGPDSLNSGAIFNPITNTWESINVDRAPNSLHAEKESAALSQLKATDGGQVHAISYWTGSKILVWGGVGASVAHTNGQLYATNADRQIGGGLYDPETHQWSAINEQNAHKFQWGAFHAFTGHQMIVWGGMQGNAVSNKGAIYDLASDTWKTMSEAPILGRDTGCSVWTGTELFIFGGRTTQSATSSDGALYNPNTDQWRVLASENSPSSRNSPMCTLISKHRIVVWGGSAPNDALLGDGKIFQLDSNTWSDMATENAPTPRNQARTVWTGKYLIVWAGGNNGRDGNTDFTSGAVYYPDSHNATGEWLTMTTNGAPIGLKGQNDAVWTGDRMITWGGYSPYPTSHAIGAMFFLE